jgi:FKBP-type peptidyl-prolyl cis-trans isomerase
VRAHYTGRLASNGAVFDSSFERGKPLTFSKGQVIRGWGVGVFGDGEGGEVPPMREGGVRRLVIPAELGYGDRGAGGVIPPGADLVFDVTLLGPRKR